MRKIGEFEIVDGEFRWTNFGAALLFLMGILCGVSITVLSYGITRSEALASQPSGQTSIGQSVARTDDEPPNETFYHIIPATGEFENYLYYEDGHQNIDLYGYFSKYVKVDAEADIDYKLNGRKMLLSKPDGSSCLIRQSNNMFGKGRKPAAVIQINSLDHHTIWTTSLPDKHGEPIVEDYKMGIRLTESQFKALSEWVKTNEYPVD